MENKYKAVVKADMDAKNAFYQDIDDRTLRIRHSGDEIKGMSVAIFFDENDGNHVAFRTDVITTFPEEDLMKGLALVNHLNSDFRWIKFVIDDDRDLTAEMDAIVDISTVQEEIRELIIRICGIVDDAFPDIMRARYCM